MDLSRLVSVQSHLSPIASRVSLAPFVQSPVAQTSTRQISIRICDGNHSNRSVRSPFPSLFTVSASSVLDHCANLGIEGRHSEGGASCRYSSLSTFPSSTFALLQWR